VEAVEIHVEATMHVQVVVVNVVVLHVVTVFACLLGMPVVVAITVALVPVVPEAAALQLILSVATIFAIVHDMSV